MTKKQQKEQEKQEAIKRLKKILKKGDTIYTTLKHVSQSGMMRVIDLYVFKNNEPHRLTGLAVDCGIGRWNDKHQGLEIGGCGFDVGFHAVHDLSYYVHGFRRNYKKRCKCSSDFSCIHRPGYTLKHRWFG